ncbi:hypothetical protein AZL_d00930 (plasmid) [Azospirillum sp. B510]|uniref:nuclear transport factor 2 family protein n=1 Tax=Azospirillum sp. (strain B510) TaxID=137722 RepID=UPI0001C4CC65|nr:nuclear transport factor 2 family protein [Azospirillum sp. B510]BAI75919.1 hypothetical protein AZL_d00930 [Azospirillum sp. B510]
MILPSPIQAYIDADQQGDGPAPVAAFAPDAIVKDEGRFHVGREAIDAWWHAAKARYQHRIEPLGMTGAGGLTEILAKVTGRFPGSPVTMVFAFRVEQGRIARLEINP